MALRDSDRPKKKPRRAARIGALDKNLAVTYFHMGRPHTIIGAERFHYRVRYGFGWFPHAIAARKSGNREQEKGNNKIPS